MNRYVLTHNNIDGEIELTYNGTGRLIGWQLRADVSGKTYEWLLNHIPVDEKWVEAYKKKGFKTRLIPPDLSFKRFYDAFGNKKSGLKAEKLWNKMSAADRMRALESIPKYIRETQREGISQAYPDTWLRNKRWTDE